MTTVHILGIKRYVSNGTTYYYLRASGEAIADAQGNRIDPNKQPEEFATRVDAMKAKLAALPRPKAKAGSLIDLNEAWRRIPGTDGRPKRDPSPEWLQLSLATRKSYERMIDPKKGYLRRSLRLDLGTLMLPAIDTPTWPRSGTRSARSSASGSATMPSPWRRRCSRGASCTVTSP